MAHQGSQGARCADRRGSAAWVGARLSAIADDEEWATSAACRDLIEWLYTVVHRRASVLAVAPHERRDLAQDAMTPIVRALTRSRATYATADNPAAMLERVAARAVADGRHQVKMAGLGGVAANGQNWRARYPRRISGEAARRILEEIPNPSFSASRDINSAAERVGAWVEDTIGTTLGAEAMDALAYVLDRLVAGVSRSALLRGAHSSLRRDPAMQHLGFSAQSASTFGVWLLGRHDAHHRSPSVLDAALADVPFDRPDIERWRRAAVTSGFVQAGKRLGMPDAIRDRRSA